MLRSMYSGISGMRNFQTKLDVIGNNVANVNTTGFKAGRVMFKDIMSQTLQGAGIDPNGNIGGTNARQIGLGSALSAIDTVMNTGSTQTTNRPLDFAIDGNGFFGVTNDNGTTIRYTRAGNFYFDTNGDLVTGDGWKVMGVGGVINLPGMATVKSFSFDANGNLTYVDGSGATQQNVAQIALYTFANPSGLEKVGGNLFQDTPNSGAPNATFPNDPANGTGPLSVGALEMSNVDLTNEFAEMIVAQRGFQANTKSITTADDILQEIVNLKR